VIDVAGVGRVLVDEARAALPHRPLMSIVQAPQTSSRQPESQITGVDRRPVHRDGIGRDLLEAGDDVGARLDRDLEFLWRGRPDA
jgi:hypothetical protein